MGEVYFNIEVNNDYFRTRNILDRNMRNATLLGEETDGPILSRRYKLPAQQGEAYLEVTLTEVKVTDAVSTVTTAVTARGGSVLVNGVSSLYYQNLDVDGEWWSDKDRMSVWVCRNAWCGEGQWQELTLSDLGVYPYTFGSARISSVGTWTTAITYPLVILCDKKTNKSYCFESMACAGRILEIGARNPNSLYVYLSSANERDTGWYAHLAEGESYTAEPVICGVTEGGFEEAVAALTEYKRKTSLVQWENGVAPLCFNDYMNCLWAHPSREKLIPLIDAAAEAGVEIFCIDAGWFGDWHHPQLGMCGHWVPVDEPFGEPGLQGILDHIRSNGMRAGLWLELECVLPGAPFFQAHPEYLLTRHGVKIPRAFPDFRIAAVREYFTKQIDDLCARGVTYFKNDYNANLGAGCDSLSGGTLQDGAREYDQAFLAFIDETLARHPGLIIENCGSGAMRSDHGHLSHFPLQSVTDQSDAPWMPSIIQGSLAQMPAEKVGIWAYPWGVLPSETRPYAEAVSQDDAQNVFCLAGGLFGCFYLSGHIECADQKGKARLKEATSFYKEVRSWTKAAVPVYPDGMTDMTAKGVVTFGLYNKEEKKLLLGVFATRSEGERKTLDLSKYCGEKAHIAKIFTDDTVEYTATLPALTVTFPAGNHGFVAEIHL